MTGSSNHNTPPPISARTWKVAALVGLGSFMVLLDTTLVNLALESMRADFDSKLTQLQWVVTAYLIALAVSLPIAGWLCSRFGYARVWFLALILFILSSVFCALAPDPVTLIAARVLKGLAGGLLVPAGHAIMGVTVHPRQLGRVVGTFGFAIALGPALGPAVAGLVLEVASWRWLFWFNVPVGLLTLWLARGLMPSASTRRKRPLHLSGLLLLCVGLPLVLYGAAESGAGGVSWPSLLAMLAGVLFIACFVVVSFRVPHPVVELRLLQNKTFLTGTLTAGLTGANMYGGLLLFPLFLQLPMAQPIAVVGGLLLLMGLGTAFALPLAGALTDYHGSGAISFCGAVLLLLATAPFLLPVTFTVWAVGILLLLRGFALAWAQMPAITAAYSATDHERMSDAAVLINISQRIGGALGAVAVVLVIDAADPGASYTPAFVLLVLFSGLTLLTSARLRRLTRR